MKINTNFKDSIFTKLFSEPDLLRELYCALERVTLSSDIPVSINTLENVMFMDLYNDISLELASFESKKKAVLPGQPFFALL